MTRIEYIRQFPGYAGKDEDDIPCVAAFNLDRHCISDECGNCYKGEATINGNPAPYLFFCPVKPGQTVYLVKQYTLREDKIRFADERRIDFVAFDHNGWHGRTASNCEIANGEAWMVTVFPTREAAEKRLEEISNDDKRT